MYVHKTPPNPPQITPCPVPELESRQNELPSGQNGPQLGKMYEKWAKFSRSGQKLFIHAAEYPEFAAGQLRTFQTFMPRIVEWEQKGSI